MELIIYQPAQEQALPEIESNYLELKEEISKRLEKYRGLVYFDTEITLAKKDRAALNKLKTALENRRKEIKAQCLRPYEKFEAQIKDLVSMLEEVSGEIDIQVKAYDQQQKEKKRQEIEAFFQHTVSDDLQQIMPLNKIWNERWLNATFSLSSVQDEILEITERVVNELKVIDELDSPYKEQIKLEYLRSLDLGKALQEGKRREAEAQRLREYEEKKRAEARQQEESLSGLPATADENPEMGKRPAEVEAPAEVQGPTLEWIAFRLLVTPEQKQELKQWILRNKIRCTKA